MLQSHDLLMSGETDAKKRLEEANRIIREQSQRGVGPSLPTPAQPAGVAMPPPPPPALGLAPPPPPPPKHALDPQIGTEDDEPAAKKQRIEGAQDPRLAHAVSAESAAPPVPVLEGGIPADFEPSSEPTELMSAEDFVKSLSKPEVTLQIRVPNDPAQQSWNFFGQIVSVTVDVNSKVKAAKAVG